MKRMLFALVLSSCAIGCAPGKASQDGQFLEPLGEDDAAVDVKITGAGTVSYGTTAVDDCSSDGSAPVLCRSIRFTGGNGTVLATPATGWRFAGWSLALGDHSVNALTNPQAPSQTIVRGTEVSLDALFVPLIHPIKATFTQATFSTHYELAIDNPDLDIIKVVWSGPNCGSFDPTTATFGSESVTKFDMTWTHPHDDPRLPNSCDATTDHKNVTVTATITIKDKTFVATYQGADTGEGPPAK
jgi:hypothetical protein